MEIKRRGGMSDIDEVEVVHPLWRGQNQSRKGYPVHRGQHGGVRTDVHTETDAQLRMVNGIRFCSRSEHAERRRIFGTE